MDHLKVHLTSETGKKMERYWTNESDGAERRWRKWCGVHIHQRNDIKRELQEVYKLWRERNPVARINLDAKALLNQKNYILKAQRSTAVEIDEIRENIRLQIGEATEDYTNEVNSNRTDANGIEYQKRDKENENTDR